jgi:hypothetical protein
MLNKDGGSISMKKKQEASEREKFVNRLSAYDEKFQKILKEKGGE